MENKTLDLLGYDPIEAKMELDEIEADMLEADEDNRKEFVEAGLPFVKLSKPLPVYNLK